MIAQALKDEQNAHIEILSVRECINIEPWGQDVGKEYVMVSPAIGMPYPNENEILRYVTTSHFGGRIVERHPDGHLLIARYTD